MGSKSNISWCGPTWNPWIGCIKKSTGCRACYMYREQSQYGGDPKDVHRTADATFNKPLKWAKEARAGYRKGIDRVVFTCSWSDWNNEEADPWRKDAWDIIRRTAPSLNYLILTKMPERFMDNLPPDWGAGWPGVGLGVSVESESYAWRAQALAETPAAMHFLSIEPCLEIPHWLEFCTGIDWAILGGESDHDARPFPCDGVDSFLRDCKTLGISPHIKQIGTRPSWDIPLGSDWKGGDWSTWPERWRVREFPKGWPTEDPKPPEQATLFGGTE